MNTNAFKRPIEILLVEDDPNDVRMTREAFKEAGRAYNVHAVGKGDEALAFLGRRGDQGDAPRPDLILLDINLPGKNGHQVLAEIKTNSELKAIPVCMVTASEAESDIARSYELHANCYIKKPADFAGFLKFVQMIERYWIGIVKLPGPGWRGRRADGFGAIPA